MLPGANIVGLEKNSMAGPPAVGEKMSWVVASVSVFPAFLTPTETMASSFANLVPPGGKVSEYTSPKFPISTSKSFVLRLLVESASVGDMKARNI